MDGSTKELKTERCGGAKNGSPVRRSLALFLGIFAPFSLGGYAARVVAARATPPPCGSMPCPTSS